MEQKQIVEKKCKHGWHDGSCCCNCKYQIELRKHPANKGFGEGSILKGCGWVCLNPELSYGKSGIKSGIYFSNKHGLCECHTPK